MLTRGHGSPSPTVCKCMQLILWSSVVVVFLLVAWCKRLPSFQSVLGVSMCEGVQVSVACKRNRRNVIVYIGEGVDVRHDPYEGDVIPNPPPSPPLELPFMLLRGARHDDTTDSKWQLLKFHNYLLWNRSQRSPSPEASLARSIDNLKVVYGLCKLSHHWQ